MLYSVRKGLVKLGNAIIGSHADSVRKGLIKLGNTIIGSHAVLGYKVFG